MIWMTLPDCLRDEKGEGKQHFHHWSSIRSVIVAAVAFPIFMIVGGDLVQIRIWWQEFHKLTFTKAAGTPPPSAITIIITARSLVHRVVAAKRSRQQSTSPDSRLAQSVVPWPGHQTRRSAVWDSRRLSDRSRHPITHLLIDDNMQINETRFHDRSAIAKCDNEDFCYCLVVHSNLTRHPYLCVGPHTSNHISAEWVLDDSKRRNRRKES
jgi:hypothetical protein